MRQIIFRPELYRFSTCREFAEELRFQKEDLILTNEFIFFPHFGTMNLPAQVVFQEKYGAGEPTDRMAEAILKDIDLSRCRRIIGIGGGTILDLSKVLAVAEGADVDRLYEKAPDLEKKRSLVLVPTTCGTGSEVTNIAVLDRLRLGVKMGLVAEGMYASSAVLIPELLTGLPFPVFAASSIDALVHAAESVLSPKATDYTKLFAYRAIGMILAGYQKIADHGPKARIPILGDFLTASNFAGLAFGTAGCGAVHAMSYPLGSAFHVAHGESNYAVFTGVLKMYMEIRQDGELAVLNRFLSECLNCPEETVYDSLDLLLGQILPKKKLREYGAEEDDLKRFADSVMKTQGRLMANNFTALDHEAVYRIYKELW